MPHTLGKPSNASGKKGRRVHENGADEWPNEIGVFPTVTWDLETVADGGIV
jgi:hypothetical protein